MELVSLYLDGQMLLMKLYILNDAFLNKNTKESDRVSVVLSYSLNFYFPDLLKFNFE